MNNAKFKRRTWSRSSNYRATSLTSGDLSFEMENTEDDSNSEQRLKERPLSPLIHNLERLDLPHESNSASILPWDKFSNWIHCICIVTFDLEVGQAIEVLII